jgi:hypothetical protein
MFYGARKAIKFGIFFLKEYIIRYYTLLQFQREREGAQYKVNVNADF